MYNQVRSNVSISELVQRATSLSDDESVGRLMNLIMQFRKVSRLRLLRLSHRFAKS